MWKIIFFVQYLYTFLLQFAMMLNLWQTVTLKKFHLKKIIFNFLLINGHCWRGIMPYNGPPTLSIVFILIYIDIAIFPTYAVI